MRKILLSTIASVVTLMALNASSAEPTNRGPLTISWTVTQGLPFLEHVTNEVTIIKKGTNDIGTNYTSISKSTSRISAFNNASLLALLSHSYGASFTNRGDALAISEANQIFVVNGTNVITNASSVISVGRMGAVDAGMSTYTRIVEKTGTNNAKTTYSGGISQTLTSFFTVNYDDSSMITDDTASTFMFVGIATTAFDGSVNKTNDILSFTENFTLFNGAGSGIIRGTNSIITGSNAGGPIKGTED